MINFLIYYNREFETNPYNKQFIFLGIFIVNLLVFGWFGVYKGINAISEKRALKKEYTVILTGIEANIEKVNALEPQLQPSEELEVLNKAITTGKLTHTYLSDLALDFASFGFEVVTLNVNENALAYATVGKTLNVSIRITGPFDKLAEAVEVLQNQPRLTVLEDLTITIKENGVSESNLRLKLFYVD